MKVNTKLMSGASLRITDEHKAIADELVARLRVALLAWMDGDKTQKTDPALFFSSVLTAIVLFSCEVILSAEGILDKQLESMFIDCLKGNLMYRQGFEKDIIEKFIERANNGKGIQ